MTVKIRLEFTDTINQIVVTCIILWGTSADSAQLCPNQSKCNFKAIPARVTRHLSTTRNVVGEWMRMILHSTCSNTLKTVWFAHLLEKLW